MESKGLTHGIKMKDKIGYALGDMGGLLRVTDLSNDWTIW